MRRVARGPQRAAGVSLALGGGFARGFAHIGVLKVLEENQIPIVGIAGTSVGSVIGAGYASGVSPEQIAAVCRRVKFRDVARFRLSRLGLASNERLGEIIRRWFRALRFEDLRIPLAVVTTDMGTGEPYVFTGGPLVDPIRASCAFPGLFEPVMLDGRCLADGGLTEPVPTIQAAAFRARVIGVSVGFNNWNGDVPSNMFQLISRAISVAQKRRNPVWLRYADVMLEPAVQHIEWDEFHRADEAIEAGMAAAKRALPQLRELASAPAALPVTAAIQES